MTQPATMAAEAQGHSNATLEQRVVRGIVRSDPEWRAAIEDALSIIYASADSADGLQKAADAIDGAMMRAIHAAARTGAVVELGVVARDSRNPLRRLAWRHIGARRARARAAALNRDTAALAAKED